MWLSTITARVDAVIDRNEALPLWMRYAIGEGLHIGTVTGIATYLHSIAPDVAFPSFALGIGVLFFPILAALYVFVEPGEVREQVATRTVIVTIAVTITAALLGMLMVSPLFDVFRGVPTVIGAPLVAYLWCCGTILIALPTAAFTEWSVDR